MSRYRVEPCKVSKTLNIYGPGGQILGKICGADDPETLRFVRFIEARDEIIDVLRDAAKIGFDITSGDYNHGDVFNLSKCLIVYHLNQVDALVERLEGEEAV